MNWSLSSVWPILYRSRHEDKNIIIVTEGKNLCDEVTTWVDVG